MEILVPDAAAVVLGSAQPAGDVDPVVAAARGLAVVRRRSGGGAVVLVPGEVVWIDVSLPAGDPLWDDDVGRAAWWLGEVWVAALAGAGVPGGSVHRGGMVRAALGRRLCFGGLGPGEVTVGGRKVVGISQRRTRAGARFQCAALLAWDPEPAAALLGLDAAALSPLAAGAGVPSGALVAAFLASLP